MKKLYRYIVKSFLGTFLFTFFIVIFILLMQFLWLYVDDLVGKGLELKVLGELFFYMSITFVPMALPLALLLASLMCFGNFGEHYELVAMKASGISMWKVMRPLVFFSLLLSGLAFVFSNSVIPVANLKGKTLLFDVQRKKLAFNIKEGVFYRDLSDYVIYVDKKGEDGSHIYGVKIYDHSDRMGNTKIMSADSGMMTLSPNQRNILFTLYNGYNYTDITNVEDYKKTRPFERMSFKQEQIKFSLKDFDMTRSNEEMYKSYQQMMNIRQLSRSLDSLERRYEAKQTSYVKSFSHRWSNYSSLSSGNPDIMLRQANGDSITFRPRTLTWPLLDNYSGEQRQAIKDMAIASAQNAKDNAAFNKIDQHSQIENIKKHKKEWHKKVTLSIACLIFFFIGAPLGSIIRKGGLGLPVVISVLFFVVYYILSTVGERMAVYSNFSMFLGVWGSSLVLLPIGLFLTFKATSDSSLLDGDSWKKFFQRFFKHKEPETAEKHEPNN